MNIRNLLIVTLLSATSSMECFADTGQWQFSGEIYGSCGRCDISFEELTDSTCSISYFSFEMDRPEGSMGPMNCEFHLEDLCDLDGHRVVSISRDAIECGSNVDILELWLPKTIRRIEDCAFRGDGARVFTPDTLDYLGSQVFWQTSGPKYCECWMSMPKSLKRISNRAFINGGWDGNLPGDVEYIGDSAFSKNNASITKYQFGEIVFPESLTYIGDSAFEDVTKIKSVVFPSNLQYLGVNSFQGCTNLAEVEFPSSLEKLQSCFNNCPKLTKIKLVEGLREISEYALQTLSLKELTIPSSVETIGISAMPVELTALTIIDASSTLYVEHNEMMGGGSEWSSFESPLEYLYVGRNIQPENGSQAYFEQVTTLKNVIIADCVHSPSIKFYGCPNLETIELHTSTPPDVDYYDYLNRCYRNFTEEQYRNVRVTVPQGSITNYLLNPVWKNFLNIREGEYSSADAIEMSTKNENYEIFDLNGRKHSESRLQPGIYLIRNNNVVKKLVIR